MYREITEIRVNKTANATTENIYRVRLSNLEEQQICVVQSRVSAGVTYFYLNQQADKIELELTHPIYKKPYLRSVNFDGVRDQLLDLPRF